jgi:DNA-binding GntR family transcriptional regulator
MRHQPPAALDRLAPVPRATLRQKVVEALRGAILQGDIPPGHAIVEADLARRFQVSRGPLREALQELADDGLIVTVPFTGTRVADLSLREIREIFSLRTELEIFAFREIWPQRTPAFHAALEARHEALLAAIRTEGSGTTIALELALHSTVYEFAGHRLLLHAWHNLGGKLQLYWSAHHLAHGRRGALPDAHRAYVALAAGDDLEAMIAEIRHHMARGYEVTERFVAAREDSP